VREGGREREREREREMSTHTYITNALGKSSLWKPATPATPAKNKPIWSTSPVPRKFFLL
jgi:hypothetical protein